MRNFKTRKCPYLAHFGLKWKNKTTLFCQTFKVEEKKVVLFFNFELNQARYGHFLVFDLFALMSPFVKFEPPCGTPKSVPIWLKIFLVYILMYWNGINNLLSTFETLFEIWSTLTTQFGEIFVHFSCHCLAEINSWWRILFCDPKNFTCRKMWFLPEDRKVS